VPEHVVEDLEFVDVKGDHHIFRRAADNLPGRADEPVPVVPAGDRVGEGDPLELPPAAVLHKEDVSKQSDEHRDRDDAHHKGEHGEVDGLPGGHVAGHRRKHIPAVDPDRRVGEVAALPVAEILLHAAVARGHPPAHPPELLVGEHAALLHAVKDVGHPLLALGVVRIDQHVAPGVGEIGVARPLEHPHVDDRREGVGRVGGEEHRLRPPAAQDGGGVDVDRLAVGVVGQLLGDHRLAVHRPQEVAAPAQVHLHAVGGVRGAVGGDEPHPLEAGALDLLAEHPRHPVDIQFGLRAHKAGDRLEHLHVLFDPHRDVPRTLAGDLAQPREGLLTQRAGHTAHIERGAQDHRGRRNGHDHRRAHSRTLPLPEHAATPIGLRSAGPVNS
jgi:hypothetical protein